MEVLVKNNAAIWIKKDDNTVRILKNLARNPEKLEEMKKNTNILAKKYSTEEICKIIL